MRITERTDYRNGLAKLDIITGNMDLYDWERALYERKSTTNIQEILQDIEPGEYDVVFMDCPPAMNMLTINALCVADYLIIRFAWTHFRRMA